MANVFFKKGLLANLPSSYAAGTFYVTTDERAMYLDIDDSTRIRLGDFIQVDAVANLPTAGASTSALYYCVSENILAKWNGSEWTQINKQPTAEEMKTLLGLGTMAYKSEIAEGDLNADLKAKVNAAAEGNHSHDNKDLLDTYTQTDANLADAVAKKHSHSFADEAALNGITAAKVADWDDAVSKEHTHTFADTDVVDAISKKHAHTFVESELNKIAAGDVAKWNGVVADHLTAADKTAIEDSIGDVNTALENYKTSNNEALAGVKATADAAAVKTEVETALAGKVDKVEGKSLIADSEIARLATLANYDDTQVKADIAKKANAEDVTTELGKKVDKVDGKDLIATSEIERLATLHNYDDTQVKADIAKKADTETMTTELGKKVDKVTGYSLVSDTEIARLAEVDNYNDAEVRGLIDDNADAIEALAGKVGTVPEGQTVMGIITNIQENAYDDTILQERIAANAESIYAIQLDYVKSADIANFAFIGQVEQVSTALNDYKTANDAAVALKADKTALEATDKTLAEVKTTVDNFFAEDAAINDTIDTLKEIANYIATDKEGAADITARVGALEGKVDVTKVSTAIADAVQVETNRATEAENGLAGRIKDLEDNKASYATTGEVATAKQEAIDAAAGDATTKANTAEANAKAHADAEVAKDRARLDVLEAIDHDAYVAADAALKTELQKEIDDDVKALADTVYTKTEVDALLTWGEF